MSSPVSDASARLEELKNLENYSGSVSDRKQMMHKLKVIDSICNFSKFRLI
jgi:hypothetical protein